MSISNGAIGRMRLVLIAVPLLWLSGCGGNASSDSLSTGKSSDGDSATATTPPRERIVGKWSVDSSATKKEWGDKAADLEKRFFEELDYSLEFKSGNVLIPMKPVHIGECYWEITKATDNSLDIVVGQTKESKKDIEMKIEFRGQDEFLYTCNDNDHEVKLVFKRVAK